MAIDSDPETIPTGEPDGDQPAQKRGKLDLDEARGVSRQESENLLSSGDSR
ncbi:hypothetical protein [uncultured Sphingomonas sp.]|uniref:hypothetical protein n=1 Tax=uncultured Sphingomonas sp. TaxID=158754 RepID=UPI0035CB159E